MIKLSEKLHIIFQGEGDTIGTKMICMRVSGCELKCPRCDSKASWDTVYKEYEVKDLLIEILTISSNTNIKKLLITGGEPYFQPCIYDIISELLKIDHDWRFEIETSGAYKWENMYATVVKFNFSPKICSLQNIKTMDISWNGLKGYKPDNYIVKIVSSDKTFLTEDLYTIEKFIKEYDIPREKIYIMPLGIKRQDMIMQSPFLMDMCIKYKFNFSPRLHILIFDNKKMV
jgi:7-carboxy-7-deazaguanine synthase